MRRKKIGYTNVNQVRLQLLLSENISFQKIIITHPVISNTLKFSRKSSKECNGITRKSFPRSQTVPSSMNALGKSFLQKKTISKRNRLPIISDVKPNAPLKIKQIKAYQMLYSLVNSLMILGKNGSRNGSPKPINYDQYYRTNSTKNRSPTRESVAETANTVSELPLYQCRTSIISEIQTSNHSSRAICKKVCHSMNPSHYLMNVKY